MKHKSYAIDMTNGPLWGKIAAFTLPLVLSGCLQLLYNSADNIVVSNYAANGTEALAAVGSTGSLINLIVNLFIGLSVGASIVVSQYRGANKDREVQETVHTSVTISVIFGFVLMFVGVCFARPLLKLMKSPDNVIDLAALYVRIYFLGMPVNMLYNFGAANLRAVGDTKRPMAILVFSGAVNVLLNLLFVLKFHWDVAGVALATIISQAISAALVVMCLMRSEDSVHLDLHKLQIHPQRLKELARFGLPAGIQGTLFALSNVIIQSGVNSFESVVMAANTAAANLEGFVWTAMNTVHQAAQTFVGQNVGARKYRRVMTSTGICLVYVSVLGIVGGVGMYLLGDKLIAIYNSDPAVIKAGLNRMRYVCLPYVTCGIMDMLVGALRGMGKAITPMIVTLIGACLLRIVWVETIFAAHPTLTMLYISYPISWVLTSSVHAVCFVFAYRQLKRRGDEIPA